MSTNDLLNRSTYCKHGENINAYECPLCRQEEMDRLRTALATAEKERESLKDELALAVAGRECLHEQALDFKARAMTPAVEALLHLTIRYLTDPHYLHVGFKVDGTALAEQILAERNWPYDMAERTGSDAGEKK